MNEAHVRLTIADKTKCGPEFVYDKTISFDRGDIDFLGLGDEITEIHIPECTEELFQFIVTYMSLELIEDWNERGAILDNMINACCENLDKYRFTRLLLLKTYYLNIEPMCNDLKKLFAKVYLLGKSRKEMREILGVRTDGKMDIYTYHRTYLSCKSIEDCSICMDAQCNVALTKCGHQFCSTCIGEWSTKNNACPLCRTPM